MYDHYPAQVRRQLQETRAQLAETRDRTAYLESVVRFLTEELNQADASRDRFWRAWQSTIVEARRQHARADQAEAELAALHAGEEPCEDERLVPTPAQWIWLWNRATPERRLEVAGQIREMSDQIDRCQRGFHEQRLAEYSEALQELRARAERNQASIVAAEDALTRVLRLAATLPAHLEKQITAAIDGPGTPAPSAAPCPSRPGFCRPCRTIHAIPHH